MSDVIGQQLDRAWHDWFRKAPPSHGYHEPQRPEGDDMTLAELKTGIDDLAAKAQSIDADAIDRYAALQGNPVAEALLGYPHVQADEWSAVAALVKSYGDLVPVPAAPEAPAEPAQDEAPADQQVQTGIAQ